VLGHSVTDAAEYGVDVEATLRRIPARGARTRFRSSKHAGSQRRTDAARPYTVR